METKFKARRSLSFGLFLLISTIIVGFMAIGFPLMVGTAPNTASLAITVTFTIVYLIFVLWIWLGTFYTIDNENLVTRSGPFLWKIRIKDIRQIRLNQKTISGIWKPTISWDCIEIDYGKYQSISISPLLEKNFIDHLRQINDRIVVMEN